MSDILARICADKAKHVAARKAREPLAALERAAVFVVWRNYVKRRQENGPRRSAAMWLGILDRMLTWRQVLRRRLFPDHVDLPARWVGYYWRQVKTKVFGDRQAAHACRYAS